jgi:dienelactone hydrolase
MFRTLVFALALGLASAAVAETLPVEHFAQIESFVAPELSPDGTHVAARARIGGKHFLTIVPLSGGGKPAIVNVGNDDVNGYEWVNDQWLVVRIGGVVNVGGEFYTRRVISVDRTGKTINKIGWKFAAQGADDIIWIARDGSPRILLSFQGSIYSDDPRFWPQVMEFDVSNGQSKLAVGSYPGISKWIADADGVVRAGYGYGDATQSAYLMYRPSAGQAFKTVEKADLNKSQGLHYPLLFFPGGDKAVVRQEINGFDALYEYDMARQAAGKPLFAIPGYDVGGIYEDQAGTGVAAIVYTDTATQVSWLDPKMKSVEQEVGQAIGATRARIVSWSRDRDRLLFRIGDANQPGAYYLYEQKAGTLNRLAWLNGMLKERHLAPVRTVRYKARDGLEISAVLTLPATGAKGLPLIVLPHGGPFARDQERWDWEVQFLANRGYAVIQPNYRGSSGFGSGFAEKGEGEWGLRMQDDVDDAVEYLAKEGIADPKRVCIVGSSYGGYAALRAATRKGGYSYRCAVSFAGVSDLGALMRYDRQFLGNRTRKNWLKRQATDFKAVSPVYAADKASVPLLLVHGKEDTVVPVGQSREMAEALKKAGKPFQYIEQPQADHHFSREEDRLQYLKALEAFLKANNPA